MKKAIEVIGDQTEAVSQCPDRPSLGRNRLNARKNSYPLPGHTFGWLRLALPLPRISGRLRRLLIVVDMAGKGEDGEHLPTRDTVYVERLRYLYLFRLAVPRIRIPLQPASEAGSERGTSRMTDSIRSANCLRLRVAWGMTFGVGLHSIFVRGKSSVDGSDFRLASRSSTPPGAVVMRPRPSGSG